MTYENHIVTISSKDWQTRWDAQVWAEQQFGTFPSNVDRRFTSCKDVPWFKRYHKGTLRFYFKEKQHALLFALRWL